jgi:Helicase associated domain
MKALISLRVAVAILASLLFQTAAFDLTKAFASTLRHSLQPLQCYRTSVMRSLSALSATGDEITSDCTVQSNDYIYVDTDTNPYDDPEPEALPPSPLSKMPHLTAMRIKRRKQVVANPYSIPEAPNEEWEWFFEKLERESEFRAVGNRPFDPIEESLLRHWMAKQRKSFMKSIGALDLADQANWGIEYLTRERKERLDQAGFHWGHLQPKTLTNDFIYSEEFQRSVRTKYKDWIWNPLFQNLVAWKNQNGHTNVPLDSEDGLGVWTALQRTIRLQMPQRRREKLDAISFDWAWKDLAKKKRYTTTNTKVVTESVELAVPFPRRVSQLKEYRLLHGDCAVPLDYQDVPGLGAWVKRIQGRRRELSPGSISRLEKIGLVFSPDDQRDDLLDKS